MSWSRWTAVCLWAGQGELPSLYQLVKVNYRLPISWSSFKPWFSFGRECPFLSICNILRFFVSILFAAENPSSTNLVRENEVRIGRTFSETKWWSHFSFVHHIKPTLWILLINSLSFISRISAPGHFKKVLGPHLGLRIRVLRITTLRGLHQTKVVFLFKDCM